MTTLDIGDSTWEFALCQQSHHIQNPFDGCRSTHHQRYTALQRTAKDHRSGPGISVCMAPGNIVDPEPKTTLLPLRLLLTIKLLKPQRSGGTHG
ncbi:aldehyde dehydrogenase [Anopheles sinensis]|uniref:Aldehyde dehydrogenase n=1 Tax=Anopheles sinensis TaxID=74873 RepID=A0A084VR00_ANOSI|nr:aldehyde dehydrogenase [Anopheles sinensis]